ncbi:MAG: lipoate--protein ligase family protein [Candidatus Hydrogenedentes bacterium]|nr:lipoate--protein ligase family protein [Candidatus Hydrogenedentota bacterium]
MRLIHYSHPDPATNLALEEVLLDEVEQGRQPDTLRFWESPVPFVVLGTAQVLAEEVNEPHCVADGVPIMRRCTAGGCVLQGPGSFNYALFLTYESFPEVASLHASYRFILGKVCAALATLGIEASHQGISDIAIGGLKVSGNAQRRRRRALLHHGTLLYRADAAAISRYIREPADRPDYRGARRHDEFVTSLPTQPEPLARALSATCGPVETSTLTPDEMSRGEALAREKYGQVHWIRRR